MVAVLRQRDYRLMLVGLGVSEIGTIMLYTSLPFFVFVRTGSVLATGATFMAQMLPRIVVGSIAGVFVDRWKARQTMIAGDLLRAATLFPLLAVRSRDTLWIVYAVMVAEGCVHQFFGSAFNASLPRLVGAGNLPAANAINHISGAIEGFIGPALGGAVLLAGGLPAVVLVDGATYLFSALLLTMISIPSAVMLDETERKVSGVWHEWLQGIRLASRRPAIRTLLLLFGLLSLGQGMSVVLLVPFVSGVLGANALQYGSMLSIRGVGALLGGLTAGALARRVSANRLFPSAYAGVGVLLLAQLATRAIQPVTALMAPAGLCANVGTVSGRTLLMTTFPDRHRGKLFGVWESSTGIVLIVGAGTGSLLAKPLGVVLMYTLAALVLIGMALIAGVALWRRPPPE